MEHWGVKTPDEVYAIQRENQRFHPPPEKWSIMKFPYEAAEHPPLPSAEDIERGMEENLISSKIAFNEVCKLGNIVVKRGTNKRLLAVRLPDPILSIR